MSIKDFVIDEQDISAREKGPSSIVIPCVISVGPGGCREFDGLNLPGMATMGSPSRRRW